MIFLLVVQIVLGILLICSIFREQYKREQLGKIIMKLKHGIQIYLMLILLLVAGIILVYLTVKRVNLYRLSDYYGIKEIGWYITNCAVYLLMFLKLWIRALLSGEIRDEGIILTGWIINYSDIRGLLWLSEKKIRINYDPDVVYVFNRQFKETWIVQDDQIAELKQVLQEKYYDAF